MKEYKLTEGSSVILDLIRGVSAQMVVVGHGISFFGIFTFLHEPNFPWMQNIAVLIFFILSGFLITYSTIRKKINTNDYGFDYYFADRFSRIYTAFIPSIIFVLILDLISKSINPELYCYGKGLNIKTFIGNLFMFQDYPIFSFIRNYSITSFGSARPFWTLAIEWWIYLFFGYLLLVIFKKGKLTILNILLLLFFSIVPLSNLISGRANGLTSYWIFGAIIYFVLARNILKGTNQYFKVLFIIILSFLAMVRAYVKMDAYDPIFAFLLAIVVWLIIDVFKGKIIPRKITKVIRFNGSFSYTLYLVHYSILDFIKVHFGKTANPYLLFIIAFIVANLVSILIGRYTEVKLTGRVKEILYGKIKNKRLLTLK